MCFVSFDILTDSVILIFLIIRLHMQARKAYAKCYHSRFYVIQLCYRYIYKMGFVDWYLYIFIYSLNDKTTSLWKNCFVIFIWIEMTVVTYLFLFILISVQ